MKTLQLVPALEQGGVERGILESNRVIIAAGWENVVVSAGGRLVAPLEQAGGRHIKLDVKSKNPLTYFSRAAALRKLLREERPDVVCAHSRVPAWLFRWANRPLALKWITFAHGANSISPYSRVMTTGDLTVTPSRYLADYLKSAYNLAEEKIRVIDRAVDQDRFDPARLDAAFMNEKRAAWGLDGSFVLMGVGRITQLKGYDVLIRALAELCRGAAPKGYPKGWRLVIVGEAEALRADVALSLRKLADDLGVTQKVVFAGNQARIAECLSLANVVVSSNVRKGEAFGRSMAEALAMGRPVVAKAFGGAKDIVRDGRDGFLVAAANPDDATATAQEFASAIRRVSETTFGDLRTVALQRFSYSEMAEKTLSVYREVAKLS